MSRRGENIYKRKDGRWEGRYIKNRDIHGKAIYGYIYGKSYKEVKRKKILMMSTKNNVNSSILFKDWLDIWLINQKGKIKESTYVTYYLHIEKHIKVYFINTKLCEINNLNIQCFIKEMLNNGRLDHKGGLAIKTVKELLNVIKLSLKEAINSGLIDNKYIDYKLPIIKNNYKLLNKNDMTILIQFLKDNPNYINVGILLMITTGIRIGEICALKNSDIDFNKKEIKIDKTLQRITDIQNGKTKIIISTPKTRYSARIIPLPESILIFIKNKNNDNYFLTQSSNHMEPRTLRYAFKRIIKKLQLPEVTVHSLRHMFASECIELGFDYKCLSEILGHSSPSTTMNLYVHSKTEYKRQCMNRIQI